MKKKTRTCPLLNEKCLKSECSWFYQPCSECVVQLIAYNTYKLNMLGQQHFADEDEDE